MTTPGADEPKRTEQSPLNGALKDIKLSGKSSPSSADESVARYLRQLADEESKILPGRLTDVAREKNTAVAQAACRQLEALPAPANRDEHLRWHRLYRIAFEADQTVAAPMAPKARDMLKASLDFVDEEWRKSLKGPPTVSDFDERFRQLYRFVNLQVTPDGAQMCSEHFVKIEKEMASLKPDAITIHVRDQLRQTKAFEAKRQAELNKELVTILSINDLSGRNQSLKKQFRLKDGAYEYTFHDSDERETHWRFEPYSDDVCCLRCVEIPDAMVRLPEREMFDIEKKDDLDRLVQLALKNYTSEQDPGNVKRLESFDLPPGGKIAHIRLFPQEYDQVTAANLHGAAILSAALRERYKDRIEVRPPIFCTDPKEQLIKEVRQVYRDGKGATTFCIDVFSHGGREEGLELGKALTGQELLDVTRQFPDCRFIVGTTACYAGGLRDAIEPELAKPDNEKLRQRVTFFLQTKPDATAFNSFHPSTDGRPRMAVSNYTLHFTQAILEGKTYGAAARYADRETKRYVPVDAEAIIDGKLISMKPSGSIPRGMIQDGTV